MPPTSALDGRAVDVKKRYRGDEKYAQYDPHGNADLCVCVVDGILPLEKRSMGAAKACHWPGISLSKAGNTSRIVEFRDWPKRQ